MTLIDEPPELGFVKLMRQFLRTKANAPLFRNFRCRKRAVCLAAPLAAFRQIICS
jgi:hypothetical protein